MANPFIPQYVYDSIYDITPELLRAQQVRGVLIDLDGTMASRHEKTPSERVKPFLTGLLDAGIRVLVLSNNNETRVTRFCQALGVPWQHAAKKPFKQGFLQAAQALQVPINACAVIGDQIYTDTLGGNLAGVKATFYVTSFDAKDFWIRARYQFERPFIWHGKRKMKERMSKHEA